MNRTLTVLVAASAVGALACSSSDTEGPAVAPCSGAALEVYFPQMYSVYDNGAHQFDVPAIVKGVSNANVTWSAEPANLVTLDQQPNLVMIRTQGAGSVTIKATAENGARCGSAPLTITQATTAEWEAGNARYNNGVQLPPIPMPPLPPADGSNLLEAGGVRPACNNCHGDASMGGIFNGVTHTPMQTAGFTDDELVQVMRAGVIPPGGYFNDALISRQIWSFFHKWTLSDAEAKGLVVYLRSLTPKSAGGEVDFSGINGGGGRGGAGGTGTGGTGGTGTGGTGGTGTGGTGGTGTGGTGGTGTGGTSGSGGTGGTDGGT